MVASNKPGFQKSETSSVEVLIYSQGDDPVVYASEGATLFTGKYRTDPNHALVSVSTSKSFGGAGQFTLTFKPAKGVTDTPLDQFVDDDWVDIIFKKHGKVYHTMRGLIDRIGRTKTVAGSGATSTTYTITGRDFQKGYEQTPLWFNRFSLENILGAWAFQIYSGIPNLGGTPDNIVEAFLVGWLEKLGSIGRANWIVPSTVPNTRGTFLDDIKVGFNTQGFTGFPKRVGIDPNLMTPNGTLWSMAQEWAEPAFCELFCDLGKNGVPLKADEELDIKDSTISVFFRDRPLPLSTSVEDEDKTPATQLGLGKESAWFKLPLHIVQRQEIQQDDIARDGAERMNAFFLSPQIQQSLIGAGGLDMFQPLWDTNDIQKHGLRRYDVNSHYVTQNATLLTLSTVQRCMMRDWYAINPYLYSGSMSLGHGRPEIRIGTRIRIPADNGDNTLDETYYVEGVSNTWQFGVGIRTSLTTTRGFIGTDTQLLAAIDSLNANYEIPNIGNKVSKFEKPGGANSV